MAKVLLVAPSVDATDVGEAWVAYQWAHRLGERHDVTLLTQRKRGRPSAVGQLQNVEVIEWDEPLLLAKPDRFNSLLKPWYPSFHRRSRRWIATALAAGRRFDVGHQPTPVAMRYPSPLAGSGVPYVIGPVGGSLETPPGFQGEDTAPWYVGLRRLDGWRIRHDPQLRRTYSGAATVVGIAPYVADFLDGVPLRRFETMSETGVDALPSETSLERHSERPGDALRLLFVGRVIRTKGVRDAIRAMSRLADVPVALDVVGDGFDRQACEELAHDLRVTPRVTFHGRMPRAEVDAFYRASDVFVFPSYREPGGNVPFEALSYGLPVVTADRGGPAEAVTDACGFRITPHDPEQFAREIAAAIRLLATDRDRLAAMSRAARARAVEVGTWEPRLQRMEQLYAEAIAAAAVTAGAGPVAGLPA